MPGEQHPEATKLLFDLIQASSVEVCKVTSAAEAANSKHEATLSALREEVNALKGDLSKAKRSTGAMLTPKMPPPTPAPTAGATSVAAAVAASRTTAPPVAAPAAPPVVAPAEEAAVVPVGNRGDASQEEPENPFQLSLGFDGDEDDEDMRQTGKSKPVRDPAEARKRARGYRQQQPDLAGHNSFAPVAESAQSVAESGASER